MYLLEWAGLHTGRRGGHGGHCMNGLGPLVRGQGGRAGSPPGPGLPGRRRRRRGGWKEPWRPHMALALRRLRMDGWGLLPNGGEIHTGHKMREWHEHVLYVRRHTHTHTHTYSTCTFQGTGKKRKNMTHGSNDEFGFVNKYNMMNEHRSWATFVTLQFNAPFPTIQTPGQWSTFFLELGNCSCGNASRKE